LRLGFGVRVWGLGSDRKKLRVFDHYAYWKVAWVSKLVAGFSGKKALRGTAQGVWASDEKSIFRSF